MKAFLKTTTFLCYKCFRMQLMPLLILFVAVPNTSTVLNLCISPVNDTLEEDSPYGLHMYEKANAFMSYIRAL